MANTRPIPAHRVRRAVSYQSRGHGRRDRVAHAAASVRLKESPTLTHDEVVQHEQPVFPGIAGHDGVRRNFLSQDLGHPPRPELALAAHRQTPVPAKLAAQASDPGFAVSDHAADLRGQGVQPGRGIADDLDVDRVGPPRVQRLRIDLDDRLPVRSIRPGSRWPYRWRRA